MTDVVVKFDLKDGRELRCEYQIHITPGFTTGLPEDCYPDECEVGEPDYYLDEDWVKVNELPKGLATIAAQMYESSDSKRFRKEESETDYGPDEPDDY